MRRCGPPKFQEQSSDTFGEEVVFGAINNKKNAASAAEYLLVLVLLRILSPNPPIKMSFLWNQESQALKDTYPKRIRKE